MTTLAKDVVVLASADAALRARLVKSLSSMRWQVREACGGAEAFAHLDERSTEALLLDTWLPDLEVAAFAAQVRRLYPKVDLLCLNGEEQSTGVRCARRHELLHAVRESISESGLVGSFLPTELSFGDPSNSVSPALLCGEGERTWSRVSGPAANPAQITDPERVCAVREPPQSLVPGIVGQSGPVLELARLIRLVAPHTARVLIEGETGTGKELVATALHALSGRAHKPFIVLNCAAIPESLLEAELFGHTRGAFTGAVQARTGRIEAAHNGTLFLDEIGEMPLQLQAKLLRFLENGELQRIGDNESLRLDVRIVAATHRSLEQCVEQGTFRLDLFHRLSVFPIEVPSLRERVTDIPMLAEHLLALMARTEPRKFLTNGALGLLLLHRWPGNIRELGHVLQRATILAGDSPVIHSEHIRLRKAPRT